MEVKEYSMADEIIIKILEDFSDVLNVNGILSLIFRTLGWWIIKILAELVTLAENLVSDITGLTTFFNSKEVQKLIDKFDPLIVVLLGISLGYIAYLIENLIEEM